MEWLGIIAVLAILAWVFGSGKKQAPYVPPPRRSRFDDLDDHRGEDLRAKQRVLDANRSWLEERWSMAEAEKASGELKHFQRWFFDPPTDRQRERLQRDGVTVSGLATKGKLSDIIGLFEDPEPDVLERLKFHGAALTGAMRNQTRARHEIAKMMADPEKQRAWLLRPADAMHKEFYRFIGKKPPVGLTAEQAEAAIPGELEKLSQDQQDAWDTFESLVDEFQDRNFLVDVGLRKPSLADIRAAMAAVKAAGGDVSDSYEVAAKILEMKPSLERA